MKMTEGKNPQKNIKILPRNRLMEKKLINMRESSKRCIPFEGETLVQFYWLH